jgi:three-Cys-motif partner protein
MDREKLEPYSGREQASVKHFLLESYLERLIMITASKKYDRIAYVDTFAGPWKSSREDLTDTSFAKAIEVMHGCRIKLAKQFHRSVSFRALFVERDPERFARLKTFADERSTAGIEIKAINEDFAESAESVARWIHADEMAFVLIDPTGWKDVIAPATLSPLLGKPNVEMLINVMWNFINLATGHINQEQNLRNIFGEEFPALAAEGSISKGANWIHAYLNMLRNAAVNTPSVSRLRTAWFAVEFPSKNRVFYYLTYVTHHAKGMIVFLEESERALHFQRHMKFIVRQKRREADSGTADIFGDTLHAEQGQIDNSKSDARLLWLGLLPSVGSEIYVDESRIADMAETCRCLISHLQSALRLLIEEGILENVHAERARPRNVVNYKKGETIRRLI